MNRPPITIWPFHQAPDHYRDLSPFGGDEDWLAFIPEPLSHEFIAWMQPGSSFGCCDVSEHKVKGGIVRIGAHA